MKPDRRLRLPLQSGVSSIWSLARAGATLVPGLLFLGGGVYALTLFDTRGEGRGAILYLVPFIVAGLLLWFAGQHVWLALKTRPSDVEVDTEGIRFVGGRHPGTYRWDAVRGSLCRVDTEVVKRVTFGYILLKTLSIIHALSSRSRTIWTVERKDVPVARLVLVMNDGSHAVVAEAEREIEKESLRALRDTIEASDTDEPQSGERHQAFDQACHAARQIALLVCPTCGAPCAPAETPAVQCRHCGNGVAVPEDLRGRVEAHRRVSQGSRSVAEMLEGLVRMPGASTTAGMMAMAAILMAAAWLIPLGGIPLLTRFGGVGPLGIGALLVSPLSIILALFFVLRAHVANRQALRLLTLHFGARPPERPGDPHGCRRCGAPLPEQPGEVMVSCPFCSAENILALDLRRDVKPVEDQHQTLADALGQRNRQRMLWGALTVVAGFLLLMTAVGLVAAILQR